MNQKKRCKVVESSDLNESQSSGVIPSHMTPVFPRPLLYLSKTQTRLVDPGILEVLEGP